MLDDGRIRIFLTDTSLACKEICSLHNLNTVSSDALSRVLSVSAIMGIMQKAGKLTIKINAVINNSFMFDIFMFNCLFINDCIGNYCWSFRCYNSNGTIKTK